MRRDTQSRRDYTVRLKDAADAVRGFAQQKIDEAVAKDMASADKLRRFGQMVIPTPPPRFANQRGDQRMAPPPQRERELLVEEEEDEEEEEPQRGVDVMEELFDDDIRGLLNDAQRELGLSDLDAMKDLLSRNPSPQFLDLARRRLGISQKELEARLEKVREQARRKMRRIIELKIPIIRCLVCGSPTCTYRPAIVGYLTQFSQMEAEE